MDMVRAVIEGTRTGEFPPVLHGQDLINVMVLIDKGIETHLDDDTGEFLPECFEVSLEEAIDDEEVDATLLHATAHLRSVEIATLEMPEHGVADPELVDDYLAWDRTPPPLTIRHAKLHDGNHRIAVARTKGQTHHLAYVIEEGAA